MTRDNPPDLASLANSLGAAWPRTDEDLVYAAALRLAETATALRAHHTALRDLAADVVPDAPADLPSTGLPGTGVLGDGLPGVAAGAEVLAAALLALAGVVAEYKRHALSILADLARFLTASPGPHADLLAATLARTALTRATRTAAAAIDGPVSRVLATIAER
jgi:hypothetical protein